MLGAADKVSDCKPPNSSVFSLFLLSDSLVAAATRKPCQHETFDEYKFVQQHIVQAHLKSGDFWTNARRHLFCLLHTLLDWSKILLARLPRDACHSWPSRTAPRIRQRSAIGLVSWQWDRRSGAFMGWRGMEKSQCIHPIYTELFFSLYAGLSREIAD